MIINFSNDIYYKYNNVKNDKQRLEHEYQFYDDNNLFYKKLIEKSDGDIDLKNNTIIMINKFDINIKSNFKKLKTVLILHRINRKGYGNINLDIFDDIQNNYININYKKQINTKNDLINISINKENINVNNNKINTNENNINNNLDKINTNEKNTNNNLNKINTNENNTGDINSKLNNLKSSDGYIIKNMFMHNLGILKDYVLKYDLNLEVFSYEIESDFKNGDFLHMSCHTFFRYTHINVVSNRYVLYDNDEFIQEMYFLHKNAGDDKITYFSSNFNDFYVKLSNNYKILKIKLFVNKNVIYKDAIIGFRLFDHNGVNNIIIKHIKYLSEK